ncbi:hypothetical protein Bbelb_250910 [Branchiostoma belcheri]|nr:hypothetical protein Bbelb_250910 [Branchiostoma belcheri]
MADTRAGGERVMRKVDLEQDVLTNEERTMMDRMNALQAARAMERSRARWFRRNIILGLALGGVVLESIREGCVSAPFLRSAFTSRVEEWNGDTAFMDGFQAIPALITMNIASTREILP